MLKNQDSLEKELHEDLEKEVLSVLHIFVMVVLFHIVYQGTCDTEKYQQNKRSESYCIENSSFTTLYRKFEAWNNDHAGKIKNDEGRSV
tara:strand:+ start:379 stop:645 length:267 start_codon:yes stop_codon:yes gene_type:complete